jgi:dUTP pyrophosphatase
MKSVPVKIKRLHPDAVIPRYARELDAGFDLVAVEDVIIAPGETAKVRTGLALALPPGYELQIRPRSGISQKTKLRVSNAPGTCDAGFRGEICVLIDNLNSPGSFMTDGAITVEGSVIQASTQRDLWWGTHIIRKGDRIAQGVLAEVPHAVFEEVDELDETERGAGGFGSTGTN